MDNYFEISGKLIIEQLEKQFNLKNIQYEGRHYTEKSSDAYIYKCQNIRIIVSDTGRIRINEGKGWEIVKNKMIKVPLPSEIEKDKK